MANMLSPRIKFRDFAGQYLAGNIIATAFAVVAAVVLHDHGAGAGVTAIAASVTETIVWYAYIALYYIYDRGDSRGKAVRHLVQDFGLAEVLDSILLRPLLMYVMPIYTHGQATGVVLATILADIIYTAVAINRQRHRQL